jgi:hypothetical protein
MVRDVDMMVCRPGDLEQGRLINSKSRKSEGAREGPSRPHGKAACGVLRRALLLPAR